MKSSQTNRLKPLLKGLLLLTVFSLPSLAMAVAPENASLNQVNIRSSGLGSGALRSDAGPTLTRKESAETSSTTPELVDPVVVGFTATSVSLNWEPPYDDGGSPVTDYVIQYRGTISKDWITFEDGVGTNGAATVTGLTPGITYRFRVLAANVVGARMPTEASIAAGLSHTCTLFSRGVTACWGESRYLGRGYPHIPYVKAYFDTGGLKLCGGSSN